MVDRRVRTALALLGTALVTAACGGPSQAARPEPTGLTGGWFTAGCEFHRTAPTTTTIGARTAPSTPADLAAAMARIERGGQGKWARSYAGIEADQAHVRAIVYRVPSAAFDKFVRNSAQDTCVVVRDAEHGLAEMTTWHDKVTADLPMWRKKGITISDVAIRKDGSGVEISTPDVALARASLRARYGKQAPLLFTTPG